MLLSPKDRDILRQHQEDAPVHVGEVAQAFGLRVFTSDLPEGISGALFHNPKYETDSGYVIFVNKDEVIVRQRFTAAHEIGHFLLHRDQIGEGIHENVFLRAEGLSSWQETQANKVAAEILMPYHLIRALNNRGVTDVDALARELQVSRAAMSIRIGMPT